MKAIGRLFRKSRSAEEPLYVGSVKSNLGHLEGAAGLAGIVKSVLVLEKGVIPPNALFEKLNPDIDAEFYHVKVPIRLTAWPSNGIRRISVNSFGMGGPNAHIILDDALSYLTANGLPWSPSMLYCTRLAIFGPKTFCRLFQRRTKLQQPPHLNR
jgi:acyl transferase domain-containing protein